VEKKYPKKKNKYKKQIQKQIQKKKQIQKHIKQTQKQIQKTYALSAAKNMHFSINSLDQGWYQRHIDYSYENRRFSVVCELRDNFESQFTLNQRNRG
jgi:hypothetical protein